MNELAVAAGAAAGAPCRYLLDRAIGTPWGVLVVNLVGSAAAGLLVGLAPSSLVLTLLAVGFLGSFTTASTVAWDVLAQPGRTAGLRLLGLHVVPGLALAAAGFALGRSL